MQGSRYDIFASSDISSSSGKPCLRCASVPHNVCHSNVRLLICITFEKEFPNVCSLLNVWLIVSVVG